MISRKYCEITSAFFIVLAGTFIEVLVEELSKAIVRIILC